MIRLRAGVEVTAEVWQHGAAQILVLEIERSPAPRARVAVSNSAACTDSFEARREEDVEGCIGIRLSHVVLGRRMESSHARTVAATAGVGRPGSAPRRPMRPLPAGARSRRAGCNVTSEVSRHSTYSRTIDRATVSTSAAVEYTRFRMHDLGGAARDRIPGAGLRSPAACETDEKSTEQTVSGAHGVLRGHHRGADQPVLSIRMHERAFVPE